MLVEVVGVFGVVFELGVEFVQCFETFVGVHFGELIVEIGVGVFGGAFLFGELFFFGVGALVVFLYVCGEVVG